MIDPEATHAFDARAHAKQGVCMAVILLHGPIVLNVKVLCVNSLVVLAVTKLATDWSVAH